MSRYPRQHFPGALVHVIARFADREFRLVGDYERQAVLERLPSALERSDWTLHAYALMSSHIHLAMVAGHADGAPFFKSLHVGIAGFLNRTQGRYGPVFAERPTTIHMPTDRMGALVAYLHNNPVRATKVRWACDSTWTSHRAWVGLDSPAPGLAVEKGLAFAGFSADANGTGAFDLLVRERGADLRDPRWSERWKAATRSRARAATALPVEVTSPTAPSPTQLKVELMRIAGPTIPPRWGGDLDELLGAVAGATGVPIDMMRSRSHLPEAVEARRLVMASGVHLLRRRTNELAGALGIGNSSASRLLRDSAPLLPQARVLVRLLSS